MREYKVHPAAEVFPMLSDAEMIELKNSIIASGQHNPIITWNGYIVDGRNRLKACELAGERPKFKEMKFDGEKSVVTYIIASNIRRRHLTESQRAIIAADLAKLEAHRPPAVSSAIEPLTMTQDQAAEALSVSPASVKRAKAVSKANPELAAEVKAGKKSLNKAYNEVRPKREKPASEPTPEPIAEIETEPEPDEPSPDPYEDPRDEPAEDFPDNAPINQQAIDLVVAAFKELSPAEREIAAAAIMKVW